MAGAAGGAPGPDAAGAAGAAPEADGGAAGDDDIKDADFEVK